MATQTVERTELQNPPRVVQKLTPLQEEIPAKNPILFPTIAIILQAIFIVLLGIHADYGHESLPISASAIRSTVTNVNGTLVYIRHNDPPTHRGTGDFYAAFQDIHVMIFIGFGFLMTFLKKYSFSAVGYNFITAAFVLEWALIVRGYMFDFDVKIQKFHIDVEKLITAEFVAAAVLISLGAVLGKTNPTQLIIMAFIEVLLQSANEFLGVRRLCAFDIGESMFVHVFGAYFGLSIAFMLYNKRLSEPEAEQREKSVYHSDVFAMIGTLFLFCFWPSFNAGVAGSGDPRLRAIVNTYISIASSVVLTYICSAFYSKEKKFDMVHIQNATLAGGVAIGTVADKIVGPAGAMIVGSVAGILSTTGFRLVKPAIQKLRVHDTCGVNNLHGMPGILAGIVGIILAFFPAYALYTDNLLPTCWQGEVRSNVLQAGYQTAALVITITIAVLGGILTGAILRLPQLNDDVPSASFNDYQHWETPDDFHDAIGHASQLDPYE